MLTKSALAYLAVVGAVVGIWALGFPADFYNAFPGCGRTWVSVDGPYNEHLVRDVGGFYIGSGILAAFGLFRPNSVHPRVVGLSSFAFNLPHLIYHFTKLSVFTSPIDQIGNIVALGLALLSSIYLIFAGPTRQ
jgi:hypothetical protein